MTMGRVYGKYLIRNTSWKSEHQQLWYDLMDIVHMLARPRITDTMVNDLEVTIKKFGVDFTKHMPESELTSVFHMLLHLPAQLHLWGPARSTWMFPFERYVGSLGKLIHNRRNQIATLLINANLLSLSQIHTPATEEDCIIKDESFDIYGENQDVVPNDHLGKLIYVDLFAPENIAYKKGFMLIESFKKLCTEYEQSILDKKTKPATSFHSYVERRRKKKEADGWDCQLAPSQRKYKHSFPYFYVPYCFALSNIVRAIIPYCLLINIFFSFFFFRNI